MMVGITEEPGDVIAAGAPSWGGVFRAAPASGDGRPTVRCEIERIGVLGSRVRREREAS